MKLHAIDMNLLVALHALLQEANVTRAAKRLGIGQPAMSHSLARLREHFEDPLLVRKGHALVLSPVAQALVVPVERAAAAFADVFDDRDGRSARGRRMFVVACMDLVAGAVVPRLLEKMREEADDAHIEVRSIPARSSEQILEDGADIALGVFEDVPPPVSQRHLFSDPFVCVVRANHPRVTAGLSLKTYLDLGHIEIVPTPLARAGLRVQRALGAKAAQRRILARVPYFSLAARILAHGDLVLTTTRCWAQALQELAPLRVVEAPLKLPPLPFSQIWHRRSDTDRDHVWFRDLVARVVVERFGDAI